jgi:phenylacetate-coenzyme A ligase PaaK-like adenylate-forming protein
MLALQEKRWRSLARRAFATSPFYRRQLAGLDLNRCALSDIPVLTKATLVKNWNEIVPDPRLHWEVLEQYLKDPLNWGKLLHGRWMVSMTSGTSGAALAIPHEITSVDWNHAAHAIRSAATIQNSSTPRPALFGKRPVAASFVCSAAPSVSAALLQTRPWIGSLFCDYRPISVTAPWQEIIDQLHEMQPDILIGYASLIGRLAQAKLDGTLKIDLPSVGGAISTGGDSLTPGIRSLCRQAFGIEPLNGYGCGESLGIARQWAGMQHMVVFEDLAVFEAVDQNENECPAGTLSDHALVTPLFNTALPLLRYRIDDRVRLGPPPAGWPFRVIEDLSGRSAMTYTFRVPEKLIFVGTKFLSVMEHQPLITAYQFRQTGPDSIECHFVVQPDADPVLIQSQLETSIRQCLLEGGCPDVRSKVILAHHLAADPRTGKVEQNVTLKE